MYDAATRPARVRETGETINSLAFVRDARMLVAGDHDGWVRLFDTETGALVRTLPGRGGKMRGVDARPGTAIVAAAGLDSAIRIWDLDTGQAPRVLFGHDGAIWDLRYSRDGRFIATASVDATVRVWDSDTGAMLHTLRHDQWVRAVAWGPGDALVTGGEDRKLRIWDARTGRGRVLAELDTQVSDLDVTPDGKKIVVVGENATISLWDATAGTGKVIARPPEKPFFLRILPDGASFVAVGGTVLRRWTLDGDGGGGGELLAVGHLSKVAVALSPDGRWVAQGDHTGMPTITELDASREHWRAPLIGGSPLRIYRHDGIVDPAGEGARAPGTAWERAVVEHGRSADVKDGLLCLITGDGRVELWDTASDSLARSADGSFARRTLRWRDGCLILGAGAEYLGRDGARVTLAAGATTIAVAGDDALVAVGDETRRFDAAGQVVARIRTGNAVTALTDAPEGLWAGYVDGRVILFPRQGGPGWPLPDRQYYVAVTSILSGPGGVLFVGYSYGRIVLRVRATGAEYFNTWVHGGVLALHGEGTRVTAVGTSGDYVVLDLSVLVEPRCAVLADVWSEVPTGWHDGQPVLRPPPASHPCR